MRLTCSISAWRSSAKVASVFGKYPEYDETVVSLSQSGPNPLAFLTHFYRCPRNRQIAYHVTCAFFVEDHSGRPRNRFGSIPRRA
jgi:hypothetical protein